MEFGLARFLEMFEERFGRTVTTAILAVFGLAVAVYCLKVIVEGGIYAYHLLKSANLIEALKQESAASHIIIFLVQIAITFVILALIWRLFWHRRIRILETDIEESEARIVKKLEQAQRRADELEASWQQREERLNQRHQEANERMATLKRRQEQILAAKSPPGLPPPIPGPQDTPEKT